MSVSNDCMEHMECAKREWWIHQFSHKFQSNILRADGMEEFMIKFHETNANRLLIHMLCILLSRYFFWNEILKAISLVSQWQQKSMQNFSNGSIAPILKTQTPWWKSIFRLKTNQSCCNLQTKTKNPTLEYNSSLK